MKMTNNSKLKTLLCDPESGVCEVPVSQNIENEQVLKLEEQLTIHYFTDPICSSCWAIEPQLRKLKLEYGTTFSIDYHMGGLLPDWSYNSGGISKPADVAQHWDEVSAYYDMPIDGDLWLENPLHSSYPPSIAFKAVQLQDPKKAVTFMRLIREKVFLRKENIADPLVLETSVRELGLDVEKFHQDIEFKARLLFDDDLRLAQLFRVRSFPSLFFVSKGEVKAQLIGSKPYSFFEDALLKCLPTAEKTNYSTDWETLFGYYPSLTALEYSVLANMDRSVTEHFLNALSDEGKLRKFETKNGALWSIK